MYNRRFPFHHTPASGKRLDFIRIMIAIIAEAHDPTKISVSLIPQQPSFLYKTKK